MADPQVQAMVVVEKDKDIFFTELRQKLSRDTLLYPSLLLYYRDSCCGLDYKDKVIAEFSIGSSILWYLDSALHLWTIGFMCDLY